MTGPDVTVLICTYNQEEYLPAALESVREQTLAPDRFETVVVNDGSTDGTSDLLATHDDRLRIVDRDENRGLVQSCNEGLELAEGEYVARLDSDDTVDPEWLAVLLDKAAAHPEAVAVTPDRYEISDDDCRHVEADPDDLYSLVACGTLLRRDALATVGGYRDFYWEEYDLYLRLREEGTFLRVAQPLYRYQRHDESMTGDRSRRLAGWRELLAEWGDETLQAAGSSPDLDEAIKCVGEED